jgi:hypothetical protein
MCGLYLLLVLAVGALLVMSDMSALACFDGDEPECTASDDGDLGLAAIQSSSWLLGAVAIVAALSAIVLALRVRRVAHVLPVIALSAVSATIAEILVLRV